VKRILRKAVAYEAKEFVNELLLHATAGEIGGSCGKRWKTCSRPSGFNVYFPMPHAFHIP
jgi:hypothetical protein